MAEGSNVERMSNPSTLPNFLIVGPPKTGSTSLWYYVRQHPQVFMSEVKEPSYFWTDPPTWKKNRADTIEAYGRLFEGSEGFPAVGEASPTYFADPKAPEIIHDTLPGVKLIALLRDPVERAFSEFTFQRMRDFEPEPDFLGAVAADRSRPRDTKVNYIDPGLYHKHLTRYLAVFPRDRILAVFSSDMRDDPGSVMKDVFSFLGVDPDVRVDTSPQHNVSGQPRVKTLHNLMSRDTRIRRVATKLLPVSARKALRRIRNANLDRYEMTLEQRCDILAHYREDISRLESLLNRDLSSWTTA